MGKQWNQWETLLFWGSKITAVGACSHEIKRRLLLARKAITILDSILKSKEITLPTKVCLVKAMVFPVVMYGCESWTIKKAECRRIDAFELWCWRRLLRVPWTARRSIQSILKEISPNYSSEGLILKLHYFDHLMWRTDSLEKIEDAGKDWRQEETGMTEVRWLGCITNWVGMSLSKLQGIGEGQGGLVCCSPWGCKELDMTEWQNWTGELLGSATPIPGIYWLLWHHPGRLWYSGLLVGTRGCQGSPEDASLCCYSGWSYFDPSWVFIAKKPKSFKQEKYLMLMKTTISW